MGETEAGGARWLAQAGLTALLDLLFPPTCCGCGARGATWCADCQARVQLLRDPLCPHCGAPTRSNARLCSHCRNLPTDLRSRSYALYRPPVSNAILHLKYHPNQAMASVMGAWLASVYAQTAWSATVVVPVPLASDRMQHRGYNQAALIAAAMAERAALPHEPRALTRTESTRSQVGLGYEERAENVRGVFSASPALGGQAVLLVDDLYTTGATLRACTQACMQAGALQAYGLTVARA